MRNIVKKMRVVEQSQYGDTLVEVLISLAILALVLATAFISTNHSLRVGTEAGDRNQALSYAQKQIELIKDAYNATDQTRYTSYTGVSGANRWFCIDDTGAIHSATVDTHIVDPDTGPGPGAGDIYVCDNNVLGQGIGGLYEVGVKYQLVNNQFRVFAYWPGAASSAQQQLDLYYRPARARPAVQVTIEAVPPGPFHPTQSTTIHWTARNASSCQGTNSNLGGMTNGWPDSQDFSVDQYGSADKSQPSGTFNITGTFRFTITCTNDDSQDSKFVDVNVTPWPPPTVNISAQTPILYGQSYPNPQSTITWSSSDATACYKNGGEWGTDLSTNIGTSGSTPRSNLRNWTNNPDYTYTIRCTGQGGNTDRTANVDVQPEPLIPHLQLWNGFQDNKPQCASGVSGFGWAWACSPAGGNVWQIDGVSPPPPNGDGLQGDGGWRAHAGSGANTRWSDCTLSHVWRGVWNYQDYVDNWFAISDQDTTHRFKGCGGYWYANFGSAGLPDANCTMYSNGVSLSGGGGIWQGGLPILDNGNAFFFPGIGWAKDRYPDAMLGGYNNLQLHCSDNGGTRNAPLACSPADCSMPQINRLDCHVGSISGPNVYSDVVEGTSIDITFYATGGNGNYVWNTDNHNNTTYSTGNSHTFTYGRPPGSGATHQIYLESGDLTHAYNGQGDPASGDDPSCTVNLTQI